MLYLTLCRLGKDTSRLSSSDTYTFFLKNIFLFCNKKYLTHIITHRTHTQLNNSDRAIFHPGILWCVSNCADIYVTELLWRSEEACRNRFPPCGARRSRPLDWAAHTLPTDLSYQIQMPHALYSSSIRLWN